MTRTSAAAAGAPAAAARRETNGGTASTIKFRGVKIAVLPTIPGTFVFDVDLNDDRAVIQYVAGDDGWRAIRDKVEKDGLDFDETVAELGAFVGEIATFYGWRTPGE